MTFYDTSHTVIPTGARLTRHPDPFSRVTPDGAQRKSGVQSLPLRQAQGRL